MKDSRNIFTYYAVMIGLFSIPLLYFKTYIAGIPISIEVVIIPLIALAALYDYWKRQLVFNNFNVRMIMAAFFLFLLIALISFSKAESYTPAITETIRYVSYIVLFFIVVKVDFAKEQYLNFAKVFGLSALIVGLYGIFQYVFNFSLNTAGLYALQEAKGRVDSTLINPNYYSAFLNYLIPIILLLAVVYFKDRKTQLMFFAVYAIYVINLILTYTRAAWVTMAAAFILMIILMPRRFIKGVLRPHILLSFVILFTFVYFMPDVQSRTNSAIYAIGKLLPGEPSLNISQVLPGDKNDESDERKIEEKAKEDATTNRAVVSRTTLWKTGWYMMKENAVLGVGIGNYSVRYKDYVTKYPELYIGHDRYSVHNSYLKVGAETGFVGLISFMLIYVVYFGYLIKLYFRQDKLGQVLAVGLFVGSVCYMVQNLSNNLFFIPQINAIFWITSGLLLAFLYKNQKSHKAGM